MLSPKKCLLYVALRTVISSRLALSAPGPTSADLATVAAEESLARARDPPSIDHSNASMAIERAEEDEQGHLNRAAELHPMEAEGKRIRQTIDEINKRLNHKIMTGDTEASSVSRILSTLETIREQLVKRCRRIWVEQASRAIGLSMTASGSSTSAGSTKEIEVAKHYDVNDVNPVAVQPIHQDPTDLKLLPEDWGKAQLLMLTEDWDTIRLASLKALSNQAQSEFHSSLVGTILMLRSFMAQYLKSSDFHKISGPLKPGDLSSVLLLFVRSRIQLLEELRLFLSSRNDLFQGLFFEPRNYDPLSILLRFIMQNKILEPFLMEIEALDAQGKKYTLNALWNGIQELYRKQNPVAASQACQNAGQDLTHREVPIQTSDQPARVVPRLADKIELAPHTLRPARRKLNHPKSIDIEDNQRNIRQRLEQSKEPEETSSASNSIKAESEKRAPDTSVSNK